MTNLVFQVLCTRHIYYVMHVREGNKLEDHLSPNILPLELLHIDLFGPTRTTSVGGKRINIASIKTDHGREFENENFQKFCEEHDILHNFSYSSSSQQNRVVERKNRSLKEIGRTMLNDNNSPKSLWVEVYLEKTSYEPRVDNLTYFISNLLDVNDNVRKFDPKSDKGTFLGNSYTSKAYRVYNSKTLTIHESIHDEYPKNDKFEPISRNWQMKTYHLEQQILGDVQDKVRIRSTLKD
ncbi:hypothetical protein CR513_25138, partial [Mucuna pruriens]